MSAVTKSIISTIASTYRWFIIGVVIIILILGYVFLLSQKIQVLQEVGIEAREAREESLANLKVELADLRSSKVSYDNISTEELILIEAALPKEKDLSKMLVDIPAFVEGQGYVVENMDVSEQAYQQEDGASRATIRQLEVSISVSEIDSYDRMKNFLEVVEEHLRLFDITSISYLPSTATYNFTLITYFSTAGVPAS